jgi:hypothetical protein
MPQHKFVYNLLILIVQIATEMELYKKKTCSQAKLLTNNGNIKGHT